MDRTVTILFPWRAPQQRATQRNFLWCRKRSTREKASKVSRCLTESAVNACEMTHPAGCSSLQLSSTLELREVLHIRKKGWSWENISWAITGATSSLFVYPVQITGASTLLKHTHSTQECPESCSISLTLLGCKRLVTICPCDSKLWSRWYPPGTLQRFLCATETALKTWH